MSPEKRVIMNADPVPKTTLPDWLKRGLRKFITLAVTTLLFGYFYGWASPWAFPRTSTAGFGRGALHGALLPLALPSLVLGQDVPIYAEQNLGRSYKMGYIVGINLCGLAFFGPLFWNPRRPATGPKATNFEKSR